MSDTLKMNADNILKELKKHYSKKNIDGMRRFAIPGEIGVSIYVLRDMAKRIGKDHKLALELWDTKVHEARLLACLVADPEKTDEALMEKIVKGFKSWDLCDQCCSNLFDKTGLAYKKAREWVKREAEFVKRAGFVMMAVLAVHDKKAEDKVFINFLEIIKKNSQDERNFVRKAVNWALRQIGKRNITLNKAALRKAREISKISSKSARWIASDAIRELSSDKVQNRLR
ncbi:DNA alkylation repair protein [Candidatus Woesearchaeota archaeon]|nr:DNA alkylation repair protein [Candidatus Woesearchaeota archaeon]